MSEALKPCPFCGIDADISHSNNCTYFYAFCGNNDCEIQPEGGLRDTKQLAIAAWNTRPVEDALVEALRAAEVMLRALLVSTPCSVSTNDSGKFRNINSFGTLKEVQAALKLAAE